jgi:hypothetical protein
MHNDKKLEGDAFMATNLSQEKCDGSMRPAAGDSAGRLRFVGWDVVLAVVAGVMIFVFLGVTSFGVLGSVLTVAGILAAFGIGEYLLWGRVLGREVARKTQRGQAQGLPDETSATQPPDEFLLELNDRERMQLLQLLERSLPPATGWPEGSWPEGSENGAAIRRELRDRLRMFGA